MIYTHVLKVGGVGVRSPLDAMVDRNATLPPVHAPTFTDIAIRTPVRSRQCREPAARYAATA